MNLEYQWLWEYGNGHRLHLAFGLRRCVVGIVWPDIGLQVFLGPLIVTYFWARCPTEAQ